MSGNLSRTVNSIRNSYFAIIGHSINVIMQFILRTIFIKTLGIEYLGVNGLFTNILSVLSLAELGLGTTIVYSLYKPIAVSDYNKIAILVKIFKKLYAVIGIVIFFLGIAIVPFLNYLIKDSPDVGNLRLIYLLFLLDSVASYFFAHYRSLLNADQKGYVDTTNRMIFTLAQTLLQAVILIFIRNFYLYLIVKIIMQIVSGFVLSLKVKKAYPYLNVTDGKLTSDETKEFVGNSLAMFSHKIGYTVLNSTDNIIISAFIGSVSVGLYSNYNLLMVTISTLLGLVVSAFQSSVGNLVATEDNNKSYDIFLKLNFAYAWIHGICAICLFNLMTPFIILWLGNKFVIDEKILLVLIINFFIQGNRQAVVTFTVADGLFYNMRFKPIIEVLLNIIFSLLLVSKLGMIGVFTGTIISTVLTSLWYEPYILYTRGFKKKVYKYLLTYVLYTAVFVVAVIATKYCCSFVTGSDVISFIEKSLICIIFPNIIYVIVFFKTKDFKYLVEKIICIINIKVRKRER